jgi:hypothetical protein
VNHSKTLISLTFGAGAVTITTGIFWYWLTAGSSKRKRFRQPSKIDELRHNNSYIRIGGCLMVYLSLLSVIARFQAYHGAE